VKLLFIFITFLSINVSAQTGTISRDVLPNIASTLLGYATGLATHELGHYVVTNYAGGKFLDFDAPYGPLGEPTMYFSGTKSQLGMTAMAGNNLSLLLSSNSQYKADNHYDLGFNYFHLANPFGYFIKGHGDFNFASSQLGIKRDKLRLMVGIPSVQNLINHFYPINTSGSVQASITNSHLKYKFGGPIVTRQSYVATDDTNVSVDLSIGADIDSYSVYYGELTHTLDNIKESPYISVVRRFKSAYGSTSVEYKKLLSDNDSYSIAHDYNNISFGYDKHLGSNIFLKHSF
jgi:uncharacterized membrane protein YqaE (UPF0057 family)